MCWFSCLFFVIMLIKHIPDIVLSCTEAFIIVLVSYKIILIAYLCLPCTVTFPEVLFRQPDQMTQYYTFRLMEFISSMFIGLHFHISIQLGAAWLS